jgi:hypothetical protein
MQKVVGSNPISRFPLLAAGRSNACITPPMAGGWADFLSICGRKSAHARSWTAGPAARAGQPLAASLTMKSAVGSIRWLWLAKLAVAQFGAAEPAVSISL